MAPSRKFLSLLVLGSFLSASSAMASESTLNWDDTIRVTALDGSLDYVICMSSGGKLNVRDESLTNILFVANAFETVKPVQSFGTDTQDKVINGTTYTFSKVQFSNRSADANIGWVAESYVKLRSQCAGAPAAAPTAPTPTPTTSPPSFTFPTTKRPTDSYKTGMRRFGASRDGGARLHAAGDIYRTDGEAVQSVTTGKIIRDRYYFYLGTYALEVKNTDGQVVRYGEIKGKSTGLSLGSSLQPGQTLGYVGTVNSGCCSPMLHFEMYSGKATGALTQSGANKYNRRSDLIDPTANLVNWEKLRFGTSY